jgi:hypothetical protein
MIPRSCCLILGLLVLGLAAPAQAQLGLLMPCNDGDSRPCGSSVGICEKGTLNCTNGEWGDCVGGTGPEDENCGDGLDNDCNGLVDDCGFNTASLILISSGLMLLVVALILSRMGK